MVLEWSENWLNLVGKSLDSTDLLLVSESCANSWTKKYVEKNKFFNLFSPSPVLSDQGENRLIPVSSASLLIRILQDTAGNPLLLFLFPQVHLAPK